MNPIFLIGMCIRLLHTDPWQSNTYKIKEVGQYSYNLSRIENKYYFGSKESEPITFKDQFKYEKVSCK